MTDYKVFQCNTKNAIQLVGDKWTLFILREFFYVSDRYNFNDLMRALKPISSRTLSLKLKKLEKCGVLRKKVLQEKPKRVEYSITEKGRELEKALRDMGKWFRHNM